MRRRDEQAGDWKEWRRCRAWDLYPQGWQQKKIAEALGVSKGAVSQWITRGREQGKEGLRGKVARGPEPKLSQEQLAQLPILLSQRAEAHGFRGEVWNTARVAELIKRQFGISYHPAHMSRLLRRLNYSVQIPIERDSQRDEQAIETWKTESWPALKKSSGRGQNDCFRR
jgi:transposase